MGRDTSSSSGISAGAIAEIPAEVGEASPEEAAQIEAEIAADEAQLLRAASASAESPIVPGFQAP